MALTSCFDITAIRVALVQHAADVAIAVLGQPNQRYSSTRELRFGNRGSVAVAIDGPKAGLWYDHENGVGGDLLGLLQRGRSFRDAVSSATEIIGSSPQRSVWSPRPVSNRPSTDEDGARRALVLWNQAGPIINTPAARYLDWRGVLEPALEAGQGVLRFHSDCPFGEGIRHPCMLALMRNIQSNDPRAVQRTALTQALMWTLSRSTFTEFTQAGNSVVRLTLGPKTGTAIKLSCDEDVTQGLAIGEGTESVLAAIRLGFRPAWALGGTSGIRTFPVLNGIEVLTILVDNDKNTAGQRAGQQCSKRWTAAGCEVFRAIPNYSGDDFNDVLRWSSRA